MVKSTTHLPRRDLFAVKILIDADVGTGRESWSIEAMFRSLESAKRYASQINPRRDFPLVSPMIVHPSQKSATCFTAYGNQIQD